MATIAVLPVEDHIPTVAGFSALFLMFAVLAGYVFLNRARKLGQIWLHPTFLAAYVLLIICLLIESSHPNSWYADLIRFGQMIAGGVIIATLCRDKPALRAAVYGYIIGSLWLSGLLYLTSYGALLRATAIDYNEASNVRGEVSKEVVLEGNLNNFALLTAQGAIVALALTLTARSALRRNLFLGITLICLIATFLPMSRGGVVIAIGSCMTVFLTCRANRTRGLAIGMVIGAAILVWVPSVVFSRFDVSEGGRFHLYTALVEHVHDYFMIGVGAGDFVNSSFATKIYFIGAHNVFIQMTISWGILALVALVVLIWQAYQCLPKRCGRDKLAACLPGLGVSLLLMMMFSHGFFDKWYSLGLGLFVAANHWIWPTGVVRDETPRQRRLRLAMAHTP